MHPLRILVVDDSADFRDSIAGALTRAGYQVVTAADGRQALEQARLTLPDCVLMDLQMPHLDGWQTTAVLTRDPRTAGIPVIAVSGELPDADALRAGAFSGALRKPFALGQLRALIQHSVPAAVGAGSGSAHVRAA